MTRVGVLALQGDVREHVGALESLGVEAAGVKRAGELESVGALVIPGGESTMIGKAAARFGLLEPLRAIIDGGLPVLGTCAGMILLASTVTEGDQPLLGALDVAVMRNAFGRQNDSFQMDLEIVGLSAPFPGVFIRAPWVEKAGAEAEVLSLVDDHPVMVRQDKVLATSFHPELTGDGRIHRMLLDLI